VKVRPGSIRLRLTLWYAVVQLFFLILVSVGAYAFVRSSLDRMLHMQMNRDIDSVATVLAAQPSTEGPKGHLPGNIIFMAMEGERTVYHSSAWCGNVHGWGQEGVQGVDGGAWRSQKGHAYRMKSAVLSIGDHHYRVTIAEDTTAHEDTLAALLQVLLMLLPCAVLLSVFGGYFLAGRALSPIGALASKAQEITAESLSQRLPVQHPEDELGRMATVFNATLARLEASFDRLRAFTANTSHELRTPLTVMRSVGEVALKGPLDAERARDVIGSMLEEVDRLTRLVECLLAVARAESGHPTHPLTSVDLVGMAQEVLELMGILAEEKQQELRLEAPEIALARGHAETLRQALANLVDNAIHYTPEGGHIQLRIRPMAMGVVVEVEDDGPGISDADRDCIFDRFYRAQPGQAADSHGTGLGLAIARSAVEASGGSLDYQPSTSGGSLFRITMLVP